MTIEIKVPAVGESITEAMVDEWLKAEGDWVDQDEGVVVLETDKASMEVPAPVAGTITKILKKDGESAEIGEVIGLMVASERPADAPAAPAPAEAPKADDVRVMPAAQRVLAQSGLDAADVQATGPGGRLLKEDVERHLEKGAPPSAPAPAAAAPAAGDPAAGDPAAGDPAAGDPGPRAEEAVRMTPLRKTVARRLVEAQQSAALLTTFNEIDLSAVMVLRKRYRDAFLEKHGVKLGFMSFFVKAVIEALKEVPRVNAEIRGEEIVYHHYYDVGVAVGGGKGLVVPVIRNAELLSFAEVEKTIGDFAARARANKIQLAELQGGTFTISNGGIYGSLLSTPILNPPQSGILGMHKIEERPVAIGGEVVVRPMMYVALTYDHRLVDGREAVTFLVRVKEGIEDPSRILLEV